MTSEWRLTSLGEAGVSLIDCEHRTPPGAATGYPYIAIPELRLGRLDLSGVRRITHEHYVEWTRKVKPKHQDVILSRRCNPGDTAVVPEGLECALGQNLVLLRADGKKVAPPFLRWMVRGPVWWEQVGKFINVGAVFDSLRCSDVPKFELPLPPMPEQHAIARILNAFDDKVELLRGMNQTLEETARVFFKSWFVDFDPVRAKSEGRKPKGIDADLAKVFPKDFVQVGGMLIPTGWSVASLDQIAKFRNGLALQRFRPEDGEARLPVVKIAQLRTGKPDSGEWTRNDIDPACILDDGDVVFSWSGSLSVVLWCGGRAGLNQHLFKVTSSMYPKWFYLLWLAHHLPEFQSIASGKATTMGHIQRHHLTEAKCVVPSPSVLDAVAASFAPLLEKRIANELHAQVLADTRDTLLPKLLSGSLRISDVERFLSSEVRS